MYNNKNNKLEMLDVLNIISFVIGMMNLEENLNQNDKQELMSELNTKTNFLLKDIHQHLKEQDEKINVILQYIKNLK